MATYGENFTELYFNFAAQQNDKAGRGGQKLLRLGKQREEEEEGDSVRAAENTLKTF